MRLKLLLIGHVVVTIAVILASGAVLEAQSAEIPLATNSVAKVQTVPSANETYFLWHVEIKRQFTERGTKEESSRTTLRLEATPKSYISLVRLDLPFVDEKNGNRTAPHLGDMKLKLASHSISLGRTEVTPFFETTFPTAQPSSLGRGKYQLSPGGELWVPIWASPKTDCPRTWEMGFKPLAQQSVSVAGDETSADINYTKIELAMIAAWKKLTFKVTPKIVYDWERDGESGGVLELEPGWNISPRWRTYLTLGDGLWGRGVPTLYAKKIEFSVRFNF